VPPIGHHYPMRALRPLVAAVAVVVCAAFVIGIRQARDSGAVTALVSTGARLTPAQQRTAASDLSSATFAYPGQDVPILSVQVALREHRFARALSIARTITHSEPDNLQGWISLAAAGLVAPDVPAAKHARQEEIRLDPIDALRR
jgi:cytochrome c-type biogenesis protein CcmH/NrfG